jgi:hypothetical protein
LRTEIHSSKLYGSWSLGRDTSNLHKSLLLLEKRVNGCQGRSRRRGLSNDKLNWCRQRVDVEMATWSRSGGWRARKEEFRGGGLKEEIGGGMEGIDVGFGFFCNKTKSDLGLTWILERDF